jgi:hypothetical protein
LSQFDQIYNGLLAVQNPKLSVCGQKMSAPLQKNQRLNPFPFLILKKVLRPPPPARVPKAQATAAGSLNTKKYF